MPTPQPTYFMYFPQGTPFTVIRDDEYLRAVAFLEDDPRTSVKRWCEVVTGMRLGHGNGASPARMSPAAFREILDECNAWSVTPAEAERRWPTITTEVHERLAELAEERARNSSAAERTAAIVRPPVPSPPASRPRRQPSKRA